MTGTLALVTCRELPEPDVDEPLLLAALHDAGQDAVMAAWDDPSVRWQQFGACVVRSTWNYHHDVEAFRAWVDRVERAGVRLRNAPRVVRWNLHKAYLRTLAERGITIVPTAWFERGSVLPQLRERFDELEADRLVVKPAVSAGSYGTIVGGRSDIERLATHAATLLEHRDVMVQRYMPEVESSGERSLVWIDGDVTHAVRKSLRLASDDESVSEAISPGERERMFATSVLDAAGFDDLLYARVDYVRDERDDSFRLMELELVEPSLFLAQHPPALERLARAIARGS